jgi:hypothetical protein
LVFLNRNYGSQSGSDFSIMKHTNVSKEGF